jgi:PIN domain nuclease of toxin-antitoxin system
MRYLLDTHVVSWLLIEPDRVRSNVKELLCNPDNDRLISVVTPWEMAIKHHLGKWPDAGVIINNYWSHLSRLMATELPITSEHGIRARSLDWDHKDPFDRMIAAQALIEGAVLISADSVFDTLPGLHRLW